MVVIMTTTILVNDEMIGTAGTTTVEKTVALEGVMALMLTGVAAVCAEAVMVSIVMVVGVEVG